MQIRIRILVLAGLVRWLASAPVSAQPSPEAYLGYAIGEAFTYHHEMAAYFQAVAAASPKVRLFPYGVTNERRPLFIAAISSEANMERLEEIRTGNLALAGLDPGPLPDNPLPVIWFSYNIHGNESVSLETAMLTLYYLVTQDTANWLDKCVVILDPCLNPDGRERYTQWYNQAATRPFNPRRDAREHREPWPGGRFNHYLFDLNRDWCWQTQVESQLRAVVYKQWMPQVMVDFHEMGPQSPYFFGPSAKPIHAVVTPWQRKFQEIVGANNARYFDREGWLFFTREVYDLLYPSYGDTWSTFQGAVGFTYEQGGSGAAGLGLLLENGDTLTLKDRIAHHFTSGLSTIEASAIQGSQLVRQFRAYFEAARQGQVATDYRSFVIRPGSDPDALPSLLDLLTRQGINCFSPGAQSGKPVTGFSYPLRKNQAFQLQPTDVIVPVKQTFGHLAAALLEPETFLEDSLTYDLTAWALPYAYDLPAWAVKEAVPLGAPMSPTIKNINTPEAYAYAFDWKGPSDVQLLASSLTSGLRPRYAGNPIQSDGKTLGRGALVFTRADHPDADFDQKVQSLARARGEAYVALSSGLLPGQKDLGSSSFREIRPPRVALIGGQGVSATAYGEIWFFLEQILAYPVTLLQKDYLAGVWLGAYDVVILPDGNYDRLEEQLLGFVRNGGRLIALESAVDWLVKQKKEGVPLTRLGKAMEEAGPKLGGFEDERQLDMSYGDRERRQLSDESAGSVVSVTLDPTHPLGYGQDETIYLLKKRSRVYPLLPEGCWNAGVFSSEPPVSGFMGKYLRERVGGSLAIGLEPMGKGEIVYFAESPVTRAFWYSGQLLLANAIFLKK